MNIPNTIVGKQRKILGTIEVKFLNKKNLKRVLLLLVTEFTLKLALIIMKLSKLFYDGTRK